MMAAELFSRHIAEGPRDFVVDARARFAQLGFEIDGGALTRFAFEATGSRALFHSICFWACNRYEVLETRTPPLSVTIDAAASDEILFLASCALDHRRLVRALLTGPSQPVPGDYRVFRHRDGSQGDIYRTILRAVAAEPPRITFESSELARRVADVLDAERPDADELARASAVLERTARMLAGRGESLIVWDPRDRVLVFDAHLGFYLRWSKALDRDISG